MTAPTTPALTGAKLDRAIIEASRAYIAAQRADPRDDERIADAKAKIDGLIALRDGLDAGV